MEYLLGLLIGFVAVVALTFVLLLLVRGAFLTADRGKRYLGRRTMATSESVTLLSQRLAHAGWSPSGASSGNGDVLMAHGPLRVMVSPTDAQSSVVSFVGLKCAARSAAELERTLDDVFRAYDATSSHVDESGVGRTAPAWPSP